MCAGLRIRKKKQRDGAVSRGRYGSAGKKTGKTSLKNKKEKEKLVSTNIKQVYVVPVNIDVYNLLYRTNNDSMFKYTLIEYLVSKQNV